MTTSNRVVFTPPGLLALAPQAYAMPFEVHAQCIEPRGEIAIVPVRGPLVQHDEALQSDGRPEAVSGKAFRLRSYESIKADVRTALAAKPRAVVLAISSPGGLVSGCFECAAEIKAMAASAGVPLVAYVDGQACSAAYALACAAWRPEPASKDIPWIVAPATADVGSIGVIAGLVDATKQAAAMGMRFVIVASGARKTDGNPMTEITPEAVTAKQAHVDEVAELFFEHVAVARGPAAEAQGKTCTVDDVRALAGAYFTGETALRLHLVDAVQTLDQLLASLNAPASAAPAAAAEVKTMSVKATLQAVLDDDKASDEDKEDAKKALAALDDKEDDKAEESDDKEDDKAEESDDADDKKPAKEDDKAKASVGANPLEARLSAIETREAARVDAAARRRTLATRPDLTKEQIAALKDVPTAALAATLGAIPKGKAAPASPMQASLAALAAGGGAPDVSQGAYTPERAKQRQRMGLVALTQDSPLVTEGGTTKFSIVTAVAAGKVGSK